MDGLYQIGDDHSALDFCSIKIDPALVRDEIRQSFPGIDGRYYAFIDYQKEFTAWLNSALLSSFSKKKLADCSYRKIYYWKEPDGWTSEVSGEFIDRNFELLKSRLAEIKKDKRDYFISIDGLNPFIYEDSIASLLRLSIFSRNATALACTFG